MKKAAVVILLFLTLVCHAEGIQLTLTTDAAYLPENEYKSGPTHFSAPVGPYQIFKPRTKLSAGYKIPVLTGESALFSGNNIKFNAELTVTPVSFLPEVSVEFTPAAFFVLTAGFKTGSGWTIGSLSGIREYNPVTREYDALDSFSAWYTYPYLRATLMFDLAAVFPGDWNHVVGLAEYEAGWDHLSGTSRTVWEWQTVENYANGISNRQYYVIGYQMPMKLSMAAVTLELKGHYRSSDYGEFADNYDGRFKDAETGFLVQFDWNEKNTFYSSIVFGGRRSFREEHKDVSEEPFLTTCGREWIFSYIGFRWIHRF